MPNTDFKFEVRQNDSGRYIHFVNQTKNFVEVLFTIDGKEIKFGFEPNEDTRGYGYTPGLEKDITKMKDGRPLQFRLLRSGVAKALIFAGVGKYKEEDIDKPTFLRHRLVKKFTFHRTSARPVAELEAKY
jgi:hypothetical protein